MHVFRWARGLWANPLTVQLSSVAVAALAVGSISFLALFSVSKTGQTTTTDAGASALASAIASAGTAADHVSLHSSDPNSVVEVVRQLDRAQASADELARVAPSDESAALVQTTSFAGAQFSRYLRSGSTADLALFKLSLEELVKTSVALSGSNASQAADGADSIRKTSSTAQLLMVGLVGFAAASVGSTTWLVSRRLGAAHRAVREEKERLEVVTLGAERRNRQFEALYQVVNEITENLNLHYVVQTTVVQALGLFAADSVVLRVLRSGTLVLEGAAPQSLRETVTSEVTLGSGAAGRAARRGRSIQIGDLTAMNYSIPEAPEGAVSALVVPLIVGARVVGTMELWSERPDAFTADDERMAELMASQVATAVTSADTHEAAQHQAHHDALTGLPNRRQLELDTHMTYAKLLTSGTPVTVVMIDIDHFKRFNDDFGHRVGDVTLQRVAEVLRAGIRDYDCVYRFGGEEFTIVLPNVGMPVALQLMDRLRAAVERTPLTGESLEPVGPVTISAGLAVAPANGQTMDGLIELADQALYRAKEEGRNRVVVYGPDDAPATDVPEAAESVVPSVRRAA